MKKKVLLILAVLLAVVLLFPLKSHLKDGGTVVYQAVLYRVEKVHRLTEQVGNGFQEGTIVQILGVEVFNNVT